MDNIYKKTYYKILISSFTSFFLNSSVRFFIPVLLPFLIISLNISVYSGSLLITSYWLGYTALQIPSGIISDKYGIAKINKISFTILTIIFVLLYFFKSSYYAIFIIQFFLGLFSSMIYISDASLVQKWVPPVKRSTYVGIYQTGFFLGASLGEFIILKSLYISFYLPYLIIFILLIITLIMNVLFIKESEKIYKKEKIKINNKIIYVALIRFSAGFLYIGFLSLFTTFIIFDHIVNYSNVYLYSWIPAAGGILTSPVGGYLSTKLKNGRPFLSILSVLFLGIIIIYLGFSKPYYVFYLSFITGILYGLYAGPSMGMASDFSGDNKISSSSGILNFSSQIGGAISPFIIGFMFSIYHNFSYAFLLIGIITFIALIPSIIKLIVYTK